MRVAFSVLADGAAPPQDHQFIRCHMIFDVKMEDFCCKARLVAGGQATKAPATSLMPALCPERPFELPCL